MLVSRRLDMKGGQASDRIMRVRETFFPFPDRELGETVTSPAPYCASVHSLHRPEADVSWDDCAGFSVQPTEQCEDFTHTRETESHLAPRNERSKAVPCWYVARGHPKEASATRRMDHKMPRSRFGRAAVDSFNGAAIDFTSLRVQPRDGFWSSCWHHGASHRSNTVPAATVSKIVFKPPIVSLRGCLADAESESGLNARTHQTSNWNADPKQCRKFSRNTPEKEFLRETRQCQQPRASPVSLK